MTQTSLRSYTDAQRTARQTVDRAIASGDFSPLLPGAADESWRRVDVGLLPFASLAPTFREADTTSAVRELTGDSHNGHHHFELEAADPNREALTSLLADLALSDFSEDVPRPEHARESYASFFRKDLFTTLNLAFARPVALSVPDRTGAGDGPITIEIDHAGGNGVSTFPASVISVGAGAEVTIVEHYRAAGTNETSLLHAGHTLVIARPGSNVRFVQLREHGPMDFHFHHVRFLVHRDATVHGSVVQSGGVTGKGFFQASVIEPGGSFRGTGLFGGTGGQTHQMEMGVQHLADHGTSSLLYKTVLSGRSHSVFLGNLEIPRGVTKVKSHQLNHNLILSKRARAESRPWLVIRAEDVGCEHGATVGDLDEEAIFFLKSRGFPESEARQLLIQAFLEEVIAELPLTEEAKESYRTSLMSTMVEEGR